MILRKKGPNVQNQMIPLNFYDPRRLSGPGKRPHLNTGDSNQPRELSPLAFRPPLANPSGRSSWKKGEQNTGHRHIGPASSIQQSPL
ncbi:hypothetical protein V6N11_057018 [Hibiscus sabdariffa]|uniref:Uncharacterized protein n=2 Tax=Hibiscus sabdariffa TaxID=183260 RepID=A0ABR2AW03_9ROSI